MSLNKSKRRRERVRELNRQLRSQGLDSLGEAGPWFSIPAGYRFPADFFRGLLAADPPDDKVFIPKMPSAR